MEDAASRNNRLRQRKSRPPVADPTSTNLPTYDRSTGRVTPPADGAGPPGLSAKARVAPADDDSEGGDDVRLFKGPAGGGGGGGSGGGITSDLAERRSDYRRSKARHWSESYPLRMRRWIEHSMHDVGSRIYCEVTVRVPMARMGAEEVLGLVEPYGTVEYVQCLDRVAKVRAKKDGAKNNKAAALDPVTAHVVDAGGIDTGHTHVVRFKEGLDAVRCFLELNGAVIDPARYNAAVEQVSSLVGGDDNADGADDDDAAAAREEATDSARNALIDSMCITNATEGGNPQDLIFVTVEFFRTAFAEPAPCGGTSARSTLPVAASKGPRYAVKPTGETPIAWLARRLAQQADEAAHWYPIVASHQPLTWEQFCVAANLTAFTLVTPTPNAFYATTLPRSIDPMAQDEIRSRRWEPSQWSVAVEALPRAAYDADDLLRLVDVSANADELMRGLRHKPNVHSEAVRRVHGMLQRSPLLVGVVLLLLASLTVAGTVFLFRQSTRVADRAVRQM